MKSIINYLVGIHKFYINRYGDDYDSALMPALVFSLTIISILYSIDLLFFKANLIEGLKRINKYGILIPAVILTITVYFYYSNFMPTKEIIRRSNQKPIGIIICICAVLIFLTISILKNDNLT